MVLMSTGKQGRWNSFILETITIEQRYFCMNNQLGETKRGFNEMGWRNRVMIVEMHISTVT